MEKVTRQFGVQGRGWGWWHKSGSCLGVHIAFEAMKLDEMLGVGMVRKEAEGQVLGLPN